MMWSALFGKVGRGTAGYHPLVCHLLDVLAVAESLWRDVLPESTRRLITADLGLDDDSGGAWIAGLAGLHDLGKASPAFQVLTLPDPGGTHKEFLRKAGLPPGARPTPARHDLLGVSPVRDVLVARHGISPLVAGSLGLLVGGHHGIFPDPASVMAVNSALGDDNWARARNALAAEVLDLAGVAPSDPGPSALPSRAAMLIAGLVSVADWIGSSEEDFPYLLGECEDPPSRFDSRAYLAESRSRADAALGRLGWRAVAAVTRSADFMAAFGFEPRPLQAVAERVSRAVQGPGIVVIEAPTGEGKTEAALCVADHWGAESGARGMYVALPTQATSDQMFRRVRAFLEGRYPHDLIDLQLLHGHAALSAEFETLLAAGDRLFTMADVDRDGSGGDGAVVAGTWFTARKRGLLAPYGVGTVDQALLGVLTTRHVFVRLFGLAGKVVVLDEVHAYDTYMSALIERLMEWLAALGSSVVLLSATIPAGRRDALLAAYARGAGLAMPEPDATPYPRVGWLTPQGRGSESIGVSAAARRDLQIAWATPESDGTLADTELDRLVAILAQQGGRAALVCSTVDRAQRLYLRLRQRLPGVATDGAPIVDLLHARFPYEERAIREERTLRRFGLGVGSMRPDLAVLVATQVVEQSLDLDFDAMLTDFAPLDLLLQRAGRLHRHRANDSSRPAALAAPVLQVLAPIGERDGLPLFDAGTEAVYDDPHVRLRTWSALRGRSSIRVPDDIGALIEAVYADEPEPAGLSAVADRAWRRTRAASRTAIEADAAEARDRWVRSPVDHGATIVELTRGAVSDDPDAPVGTFAALTRLDADSVQVICLQAGPDGPALDGEPVRLDAVPDPSQARRLLRRSLRIGQRRLIGAVREQPVPPGWRHSALLRDARALVFDSGRATLADMGCRPAWLLTLDPELGLVAERITDGGAA